MTAIDLLAVIRELRPRIIDSHLANVYQPSRQLFILKLRTRNAENLQLLAEAGRRIHFTDRRYGMPENPSSFCRILRRSLGNAVLTDINQYDLDRIVILDFQKGPSAYKIIIELLDRGNVILTDQRLTIVAASAPKTRTARPISKGATYVFPKTRGVSILEVNPEEASLLFQKSKSDVVRSLVQFLNLPGEAAEEICSRTRIDKHTPASSLNPEEVQQIIHEAVEIGAESQNEELKPAIIRRDGRIESVTPLPLTIHDVYSREETGTFSHALDDYFSQVNQLLLSDARAESKSKWEHVIEEQQSSSKKLNEEAQQLRGLGKQIFAHLHEIERLLETLRREKDLKGSWKSAGEEVARHQASNEEPRIVSINPRSGTVSIQLPETAVEIDYSRSAAANASQYYQRAKDAEAKAKRAMSAAEETKAKFEQAEGADDAEEPAERRTIVRKYWYERFRWFRSTEDCLVVGGKDASQNEVLIKRYMEPTDIVVHAETHGAPFALVKPQNGLVGEKTLIEAMQFAVSYSSAWRGGLGSSDAYWVRPEQVSKSAPSGEFLVKGAFMIRGEKNLHAGIPLRLAIGVEQWEDGLRIIAGPESAIRAKTSTFVVIIPGNVPQERFAALVRQRLAQLLPEILSEEVRRLDDSELIRVVPAGSSSFEQGNS